MMALLKLHDKAARKAPYMSEDKASLFNAKPAIRCIDNIEQFSAIAKDWRSLQNAQRETFSFFQTFDWCHQWWLNVGAAQHNDLRIFILHEGEMIKAIWPMQLSRLKMGVKALVPLTYPHIEYANMLADENLSPQALSQFIKTALDMVKCDLVILPKIPMETKLDKATKGLGVTAPIDEIASVFQLDDFKTKDDYLASLSTDNRRRRKKRRNKLAKQGEVKFEVLEPFDNRFVSLVEKLFAMKFNWLQHTGRNDAKLKITGLQQALASLPPCDSAKALLHVLSLDDIPQAIELGFLQKGHYYAYIGAFNWDMRNYSIGKIQMEQTLLWAVENGVQKYDLLAEPAGYKDSWSNGHIPLQNRTIALSPKGYIYGVTWQHYLRPLIKRAFNSLPMRLRVKILGSAK